MADYIDRQATIDKINERQRKLIYCFGFESDAVKIMDIAKSIVIAIPPADVAPVVRCRDCKHYYFADNRVPQEQRYICDISGEIWKPDDFCSYGERREE